MIFLRILKPDFVFVTGDYVTWEAEYDVALSFFSKLEAKVGVWAVMGDYDYSLSRKSCPLCHEPGSGKPTQHHQIRFLKNSFEQVGGGPQNMDRAYLDFQRLYQMHQVIAQSDYKNPITTGDIQLNLIEY